MIYNFIAAKTNVVVIMRRIETLKVPSTPPNMSS